MSNTIHEIITSRLVYGVSSKSKCEDTLKFIQFFKNCKDKTEKVAKQKSITLNCFSHDPVSAVTQTKADPTYICGVIMGISYTGVCHINEEVISLAKKMFNEGLDEYNAYTLQKNKTSALSLDCQLILFGEGITQWETN
jgi:hypothetical protein